MRAYFASAYPGARKVPTRIQEDSNPGLSCIIIHRVKTPWTGLCLAEPIGREVLTETRQRIGTGPEKETPGEIKFPKG
jgi:hypothetical protein